MSPYSTFKVNLLGFLEGDSSCLCIGSSNSQLILCCRFICAACLVVVVVVVLVVVGVGVGFGVAVADDVVSGVVSGREV